MRRCGNYLPIFGVAKSGSVMIRSQPRAILMLFPSRRAKALRLMAQRQVRHAEDAGYELYHDTNEP